MFLVCVSIVWRYLRIKPHNASKFWKSNSATIAFRSFGARNEIRNSISTHIFTHWRRTVRNIRSQWTTISRQLRLLEGHRDDLVWWSLCWPNAFRISVSGTIFGRTDSSHIVCPRVCALGALFAVSKRVCKAVTVKWYCWLIREAMFKLRLFS